MSRYFWPILTPLPCHTLLHIPGPLESTSHISDLPPIFSRPSTKISDKSPLYKFYLNCSQRLLSGGFVRVGFCPFPLLSQYICYNRKLNITLNFMFHMFRVTIRPGFPGHVLFYGLCPGVRAVFQKCPGFVRVFNQSVPDHSKTWLLAGFFPSLSQFDRSIDR